MLGIANYELNYLNNSKALKKSHCDIFMNLIGKTIDSYFVQWNTDDDNWNEDGPIVLLINENQFEFTAFQLAYSLTINKIELTNKLDWYGAGNEMPLKWNKNAFDDINSILNNPISRIYALEYGQGSSFHLTGFEFEFIGLKENLHISNGLDCNVIKLYKTEVNDRNKRIEMKK